MKAQKHGILLTGLAIFSLFSFQAFSQNTFPSSGNTGCGTSTPLGILHTYDNGRDYYVNKAISGVTEDSQGENYLLLHEIYSSTAFSDHYVMGKVTGVRGATGAYNRKWTAEVNTASAYITTRGSCLSYNEPTYLVTLTYNSKPYIALVIQNSALMYDFSFTGYAQNEELAIVYDQDVSNVQMFTATDPISTNSAVGIGTTSPAEKLDVNGNINMAGTTGRRIYMGHTGSTFGIAYNNSNPNHGLFYTESSPDYVSISPNGNATNGVMNILGDGKVGIGTATPGEKLEVNGNIKLSSQYFNLMWPSVSGFAGGVTGNDNSSPTTPRLTLYHGNEIVFETGTNTADDAYNRMIIDNAGQVGIGTTPAHKLDVDGDINFPIINALKIGGTDVLKYYNTTNFLLGFGSGTSLTSGQYFNTLIGTFAGNTVISDYNTIIGNDAALDAVYGGSTGDNVIIGNRTANGMDLSGSEIGRNTYVGADASVDAVGSENVHLGYLSGNRNTGNQNTFIGTESIAMGGIGGGNGNTAAGYKTEVIGDNNVVLGYEAKAYIPGLTPNPVNNSVAIGVNAWVKSDNTIVLGDALTTTAVVIGWDRSGNAVTAGWPSCIFEVNGDSYISGTWYPSDANFKKNVKPFSSGLELLRNLKPVNYEYRDDVYTKQKEGDKTGPIKMNFTKGKQFGFLAQDLEKVIPEMVATRGDGSKMVNYNQLFGVLVKGFQEQDEKVTENATSIATLTAQIAELKEANAQILLMLQDLQQKLNTGDKNSGNNLIINDKLEGEAVAISQIIQSDPNPFRDQTTVKFFVVNFEKEARMVVSDGNAQQIFSFNIDQKGAGQVLISGNSLKTGTYTIQLIIDGKIIDTKKVLFVK